MIVIEPCLMCGTPSAGMVGEAGAVVCDGCDYGLDESALDDPKEGGRDVKNSANMLIAAWCGFCLGLVAAAIIAIIVL